MDRRMANGRANYKLTLRDAPSSFIRRQLNPLVNYLLPAIEIVPLAQYAAPFGELNRNISTEKTVSWVERVHNEPFTIAAAAVGVKIYRFLIGLAPGCCTSPHL